MVGEKAEKVTTEEKKPEARKSDPVGKGKLPRPKHLRRRNPTAVEILSNSEEFEGNANLLYVPEISCTRGSIQQLNSGLKRKNKFLVTVTKPAVVTRLAVLVIKYHKMDRYYPNEEVLENHSKNSLFNMQHRNLSLSPSPHVTDLLKKKLCNFQYHEGKIFNTEKGKYKITQKHKFEWKDVDSQILPKIKADPQLPGCSVFVLTNGIYPHKS
ncbi:LOW QUALITY PROTEIN: 60S ribosomal protein L6, partial [Galemys pyrenaicus]